MKMIQVHLVSTEQGITHVHISFTSWFTVQTIFSEKFNTLKKNIQKTNLAGIYEHYSNLVQHNGKSNCWNNYI